MINDQEKRLRLLHKSQLLDSAPEEAFDRFTHLAITLLDVPVSLMTLIDDYRQFFKSSYGLPEPWISRRQTPLSHSLCQYVVVSRQPLIVADARMVTELKENLAISELGMIAYLGFPLLVEDQVLGSFCAVDTKPHIWSQRDITIVRALASLVSEELALRMEAGNRHNVFTQEEGNQPSSAHEEALPGVKKYTELILEHMTDVFFQLDAHFRVLYMNQQAERYAGVNRKEWLGKVIWTCAPNLLGTPCEQHIRQAMETRQVAEFETVDSLWRRWVAVRIYPMYDGLCVYFHDIHKRKQAEEALRESEARFRGLVDSNLIGITVSDLTGAIQEANDAFLQLLGYSREDLAAGCLHYATLTPPEYQEQHKQILGELLTTGKVQLFEKAYLTKEGKRVPVLLGRTLLQRVGAAPLALTFVLDQTARKEIERQKDLFLGMTGHELKTPLAALRGTLQLIQRRMKRVTSTADSLSPELRAFFDGLTKSVSDLVRQIDVQTRLINDLLDVSRITANTLKLDCVPCDLNSIVCQTVEDLRVTAPDRALLLDVSDQTPVYVLADRDRISQVITNYVTNALRYSPPDQPVQIGLTLQDRVARVWVRDRGPGLSEEAQQEIWQRFHQVKGVPVLSGSGKGLGLGLYICQMLIALHQGEVGVESAPGEGSTFWFTLPLAGPNDSA